MADLAFEAIGTSWRITTPDPLGQQARTAVADLIEDADRAWSRFRADSRVQLMAATPGRYEFDATDAALLDFYAELFTLTGGAVTPLVGRSLEHLGYDASYRLTPLDGVLPVPRWDPCSDWDGTALTVRPDQLLDVGAAGKGWLVDRVSTLLTAAGHGAHVVDAGGDLLHRGPDEIRVALEHPADPRRAIGVITLRDAALCGSAVNRRAWGDGLHHVIDPSGTPTPDVIATWVVTDATREPWPAMVADGLATALFFAEGDTLGTSRPFHYVRITRAGRLTHDAHLPGEVFR